MGKAGEGHWKTHETWGNGGIDVLFSLPLMGFKTVPANLSSC